MKIMKKNIISILVLATFSLGAVAQEQTDSDVATLGSIDSIDARITFEQKKLALEEAQLARKKTQEQLNENKFIKLLEAREKELLGQFSNRETELLQEIDRLKGEIARLQSVSKTEKYLSENSIEGVADKVYVTSINGVGSNLTATIYFNETVDKVNAGAAISDSITIQKVHPNGITISDGGVTKFIALTNEKFAFSKTFNKDAAELLQGQTRSPLSIRGN